jgi:hypothetical protein
MSDIEDSNGYGQCIVIDDNGVRCTNHAAVRSGFCSYHLILNFVNRQERSTHRGRRGGRYRVPGVEVVE